MGLNPVMERNTRLKFLMVSNPQRMAMSVTDSFSPLLMASTAFSVLTSLRYLENVMPDIFLKNAEKYDSLSDRKDAAMERS